MKTRAGAAAQPCYISPALLEAASLSPALRRLARGAAGRGAGTALVAPVAAGFASELLSGATAGFPPATSPNICW
mgnify:CR=1 FL=1